ncbi:STAS domain-containing protein [Actinophytocola algeriensis]|uniref:Anti-anti-sigma regulatory factor n=1 Tax=Actinophytocola algeriensis TaxID=1768010 RepID=A0A7W7Q859_9PSEU|nr:STAS domain-containing protein [Actinophytocola algeriensis]MBB4908825.1 anti-anti-sigma regulatory factor [Actinophytocola algeriensis]MBE1474788.1 anti-anti-sigma regulatory factor [Actinophytocola algeriensis]
MTAVDWHVPNALARLSAPVFVTLAGVLDEPSIPVISHAFDNALRWRPMTVLLKLSDVTAVHSSVLDALLVIAHRAALCEARLVTVAALGEPAHRAIDDAGLSQRLSLYPTLAVALETLAIGAPGSLVHASESV